jgi:hypothetical protein
MSQQSNGGLRRFLGNSNARARRIVFKGRDFQTQMAELTQAAAIIKAVYFRPVPGDPAGGKAKIKNDLLNADRLMSRDALDPDGKTRLNKVIDQIEEGYGAGATPWNRPIDERPRITILESENP